MWHAYATFTEWGFKWERGRSTSNSVHMHGSNTMGSRLDGIHTLTRNARVLIWNNTDHIVWNIAFSLHTAEWIFLRCVILSHRHTYTASSKINVYLPGLNEAIQTNRNVCFFFGFADFWWVHMIAVRIPRIPFSNKTHTFFVWRASNEHVHFTMWRCRWGPSPAWIHVIVARSHYYFKYIIARN